MAELFFPMPQTFVKANRHRSLAFWRQKRLTIDKKLFARVKRFWRDCVGAYVEAMVDIIADHQLTGQTLHTLVAVAEQITYPDDDSGVAKSKKNYVNLVRSAWNPKQLIKMNDNSVYPSIFYEWSRYPRSAGIGEILGENAVKNGVVGIYYGTPKRPSLSFKFRPLTYQHYKFEPDWGSLAAGEEALNNFWESNFSAYLGTDKLIYDLMGG